MIYEFFKIFKQPSTYLISVPILFYFIYSKKEENWIKILKILSFTLNAILFLTIIKSILKIPLPNYPNTFAFPSGHVYMTVAYFGIFFIEWLKNRKIAYILILLCGVFESYRVVFYGFHDYYDAISAFFICVGQLYIFKKYILDNDKYLKISLFFGIFFNPILIYIEKFYAPTYQLNGLMKNLYVGILIYSLIYIRKKIFQKFKI